MPGEDLVSGSPQPSTTCSSSSRGRVCEISPILTVSRKQIGWPFWKETSMSKANHTPLLTKWVLFQICTPLRAWAQLQEEAQTHTHQGTVDTPNTEAPRYR